MMESLHSPIVAAIRRFNRFYTNLIGLLDQHILNSAFSLSEARVLYEIGHYPNCTAKYLIEELRIDPGYLSRIIKRFETQGLTYRVQSNEDGRLYYLYLTELGQNTLAQIDQLSTRQIADLVERLPEFRQSSLVACMNTIETALSNQTDSLGARVTVRSELKPGDIGYLIHLHGWIYAAECGYNHRFEQYVCQTFDAFLEHYDAAQDRFWFAELDGEIIGAIAIVGHSAVKAQLRWFILHPQFRGIGLGKRLLQAALQFCSDQGYQTVFLETTNDQTTAIAMYRKAGFVKIAEHAAEIWGKRLVEQTYEWIRP